jgi:hypothetical protein
MVRPKYRVIEDHVASFPFAMVAVKTDRVAVGKEDSDMPGWFWCKDEDGVEAWVPGTYLEIDGGEATFIQDYNSMELDAKKGGTVQYLGETLSWVECLNSKWEYGWLPKKKLEKL